MGPESIGRRQMYDRGALEQLDYHVGLLIVVRKNLEDQADLCIGVDVSQSIISIVELHRLSPPAENTAPLHLGAEVFDSVHLE